MRRGCISIGEIKCNGCERIIKYPNRYLAIEEKDGVEDGAGDTMIYCLDCSLKKGYARYKAGRGEEILTYFPD